MKYSTYRLWSIALILSLMVAGFYLAEQSKPDAEQVSEIIDGDTFAIAAQWSPYDIGWKIRVRGIDAPEQGGRAQCEQEETLAIQAERRTKELIRASGNAVTLKNVEHDKYGGRLLADVYLKDGESLGDILLEEGLAEPYEGRGPKQNWCVLGKL